MANSVIRFGIVGLGNIGKAHAESIASGAVKGAELAAVCSRSLASDFSSDSDISHYQEVEHLINDPQVDAVLVATPTLSHHQIGLDVLKSGKHLLMEKPIARSVLEADQLASIELQPNQVFGAVLNQRYDPAYAKIKSLLSENIIGEIQRVSWTLTHWYRPDIYFRVSDWRGTWQGEGGGLLLNQCIHNLDVLQWLVGMPEEVWAKCAWGRYHDIEVEDEVTAIMTLENGATVTFISSTGEAPGSNLLTVVGEKGSLTFDGNTLTHFELDQNVRAHSAQTTEMFSMPGAKSQEIPLDDVENQHVALLQDFVSAIEQQKSLTTNSHAAVNSIELADGILLSAWENRSVPFPLDRKSFEIRFQEKLKTSSLREKEQLDVSIDLQKSFR